MKSVGDSSTVVVTGEKRGRARRARGYGPKFPSVGVGGSWGLERGPWCRGGC